jgi:probable HAF family extracellular repeat protein
MLRIHRTVLVAALGLVLGLPALVSSAATSVASPAQQTPEAQRSYRYTDLGVLGDPGSGPEGSTAWSTNSAEQVIGASTTDVFAATHAFLWQNGQLLDLGTLSSSIRAASAAYGINDVGVIVGQTHVDPDNEPPHMFRYRNGVMRDLGTGFGSGSFSRAWDINNNGWIVGERSRQQSSPVRAFLYRNGRFRSLGTLGGRSPFRFGTDSIAHAINDRGQIVGTALPPNPPLHGFLWENGVMRDLGTLGGNGEATTAFAVNNGGQVVGASQAANGQTHAFLWQNGVMQDLGTLGGNYSAAYGINVHGQIVGGSRVPNAPFGNAGHAFLWENGQLIDLNGVVANLPADVVLESARAINDDGRIVGTSCSGFCEPGATAPSHAFLLTPSAR